MDPFAKTLAGFWNAMLPRFKNVLRFSRRIVIKVLRFSRRITIKVLRFSRFLCWIRAMHRNWRSWIFAKHLLFGHYRIKRLHRQQNIYILAVFRKNVYFWCFSWKNVYFFVFRLQNAYFCLFPRKNVYIRWRRRSSFSSLGEQQLSTAELLPANDTFPVVDRRHPPWIPL